MDLRRRKSITILINISHDVVEVLFYEIIVYMFHTSLSWFRGVECLVCLKLISTVLSKSISDFSKLWGMCWFSGNRGWRLEIWDSAKTLNFNDLDEIAAMNDTLDGYSVSYVEEAKYVYNNQKHVARLSGYFVAPDSGKFAFFIKGKYTAKMYFTTQNNRVCLTVVLRYLLL